MWHTEIPISDSPFQFTHTDRMIALGSCFADETGQRLKDLQFDILVNPFGVLYNPVSLSTYLDYASGHALWPEKQVFHHQDLWRHFDFHSRISHTDRSRFIQNVRSQIENTRARMQTASLVLLTFGTAFVWERDGIVVGNCHKLPLAEFNRRMLTAEETHAAIRACIQSLKAMNEKVVTVLTVSPIRHQRDGLIESSWSKARLLDGCRSVEQTDERVQYFPSYEIMIDELRDYRFYASDMIHPSKQAVDHIFSRFLQTYFAEVPEDFLRMARQIRNFLNHRSRNKPNESPADHAKIGHLLRKMEADYGIKISI